MGTRTQDECILYFLRLPIEDPYLEDPAWGESWGRAALVRAAQALLVGVLASGSLRAVTGPLKLLMALLVLSLSMKY